VTMMALALSCAQERAGAIMPPSGNIAVLI